MDGAPGFYIRIWFAVSAAAGRGLGPVSAARGSALNQERVEPFFAVPAGACVSCDEQAVNT